MAMASLAGNGLVCSLRGCGAALALANKKRDRDRRPTYLCAQGHLRKTCNDCGKQGGATTFHRHVCKAASPSSSSSRPAATVAVASPSRASSQRAAAVNALPPTGCVGSAGLAATSAAAAPHTLATTGAHTHTHTHTHTVTMNATTMRVKLLVLALQVAVTHQAGAIIE